MTLYRSLTGLRAASLQLQKAQSLKEKPGLDETLRFGTVTTDHILEIDWEQSSGWGRPLIKPYADLLLDPAASVFHHCTEVYEGLKAYRSAAGEVLLFRPHDNMQRMRSSCRAVGLPDFDGEELLSCIKELVRIDSD